MAPLDSTFETSERRAPQTREMRTAPAQPVTGGNLVLVTHGLDILALTAISPAESEVVIARSAANGKLELIGRLLSDR